jgi:hypothetical protein
MLLSFSNRSATFNDSELLVIKASGAKFNKMLISLNNSLFRSEQTEIEKKIVIVKSTLDLILKAKLSLQNIIAGSNMNGDLSKTSLEVIKVVKKFSLTLQQLGNPYFKKENFHTYVFMFFHRLLFHQIKSKL